MRALRGQMSGDPGQFATNSLLSIAEAGRGGTCDGACADPLFAIIRLQGKYWQQQWQGGRAMTVRVVAAAILVMMAMPAQAQMGGRHHGGADKTEPKKPQVDDKAYKAALERIPDSKEKYDPWGVARPVDPAKKAK